MPQTWESYINSVEDGEYAKCLFHRKSLDLPVDFDLTTVDCETAKCKEGCPFD